MKQLLELNRNFWEGFERIVLPFGIVMAIIIISLFEFFGMDSGMETVF